VTVERAIWRPRTRPAARASPPTIIVDEAHLSDAFLLDLAGLLDFAFDSRVCLTF